jgi:phosphoribosylformylglycinamidine synthase subunit PurQ / glutaminase
MNAPDICVLRTDGTNCDMETAHALNVAGGASELVHINELREGSRSLHEFGALAIPGGFSYGDYVASGQVLANEIAASFLSDELRQFTDEQKPIIGICNGFQVLVRTGLLPAGTMGEQRATLATNDVGHFVCRWVDLRAAPSVSSFVNTSDELIPMHVAHGEGRFTTDAATLEQLQAQDQIVYRYAVADPEAPVPFPANPNGSLDDIAGICDPTGTIIGMMPHPERSIEAFHPAGQQATTRARSAAYDLLRRFVIRAA